MALTCDELLRRLDEETPLHDAGARQHLADCAACRTAVKRAAAVSAKLEEWAASDAPPFLHGRVMAHVRAETVGRAGGRSRAAAPGLVSILRRFWWAAPSLATALLLAIVVSRTLETPVLAPAGASHGSAPANAPQPSAPGVVAPLAQPSTPAGTPVRPTPAPAAPEPVPDVVRGSSRPAATPGAVACDLVGPDATAARRRLALDARLAPQRGVSWPVVVATSGEVHSAISAQVPLDTLEEIAALDLPPGRYVLRRAR